jgi:transposase InsO family protein
MWTNHPCNPKCNSYFLLLVDDYTRYMWVVLLSCKNSTADAIKRVQVATEGKSGNLLGALRTDHGGEFIAAHFKDYCAELGVRRELTAPYTP